MHCDLIVIACICFDTHVLQMRQLQDGSKQIPPISDSLEASAMSFTLVIRAVPNELRPSVKMCEGYRQMSADDTRKMFAHFEDLNRSAKVAARNMQKINCIDR